jgi:hypothetical protein
MRLTLISSALSRKVATNSSCPVLLEAKSKIGVSCGMPLTKKRLFLKGCFSVMSITHSDDLRSNATLAEKFELANKRIHKIGLKLR